ncbi:MAG: amidinotransferase [Prevotella sp.]|nr:amidinotransferase [Prevotella sp.]
MQTTQHVLMVRPVRFAFNEETAGNNAFQQKDSSEEEARLTGMRATQEFDDFVALLRENGVRVEVLQDTPEPQTPDSIFPNNCFSTHVETDADVCKLVLYPMFAPNRRLERDKLLKGLMGSAIGHSLEMIDLTRWEQEGKFLEGTGSLILDREHRMAFACRSPRTHEDVVREWAREMGYDYFLFDSTDKNGMAVYHTNVVMHIGTRFAVVCLESVKDEEQRRQLVEHLQQCGKEIVAISLAQMYEFAGNMLELRNDRGEKLLIMSQTAFHSLTMEQITTLEQDVRIVAPAISAIEKAGGGSARCMLAELFGDKVAVQRATP